MGKMTYKALGVLLSYPNETLISGFEDIKQCLKKENLLSPKILQNLEKMMSDIKMSDLITQQAHYVATFDQSPQLSLHLFEHIHGESRDRGAAMIDLGNMYQAKGMKVANGELPDYIPAFLEYLSALPHPVAKKLLNDPIHVVEKIKKDLKESNNHYHIVFEALLDLAA